MVELQEITTMIVLAEGKANPSFARIVMIRFANHDGPTS
jgi:hypothetical protein